MDGARASAGGGWMAAPMALHGQGRGISFSKRDTPPLDPPRENSIGSLKLEGVRRLGNDGTCVAALLRSPPLVLLYDLPLLLLSAAALPIFRRCRLISFCRNANISGSAYRGERSNAALVGTCRIDNIRSRRKLRKAADTQAKRQRVVEATQIV